MPSLLHEALVGLFKTRPELAAALLRSARGVRLPEWEAASLADADLAQIVPTEYRADAVVTLAAEGEAMYGVVVEVQLRRDDSKQYSWPLYAAALRARLRCPTCVLVVAPRRPIAKWARRPIELGGPGSRFIPLVVGPDSVPKVLDQRLARAFPELAVLSVVAHRGDERMAEVAVAALDGAAASDEDQAVLYFHLLLGTLGQAARRRLRELMQSGKIQYESEFGRQLIEEWKAEGKAAGLAEGKAAGRAEALIAILDARGIAVSDTFRAEVLACTDLAQLDHWIRRAADATSEDDVWR